MGSNHFSNVIETFSDLSPKRLINLNLASQMAISGGFAISTFFVATFATAGFNAVATALGNLVFAAAAFYVINNQQDPGSVGLILGAGGVISFLSLLTAIYWGELSRCEQVNEAISMYTCKNKAAMKAVCAFAIFMFLLQLQFTVLLHTYKIHILAESRQYSEVPIGAAESDELEGLYHSRPPPGTWTDSKFTKQQPDTIIV